MKIKELFQLFGAKIVGLSSLISLISLISLFLGLCLGWALFIWLTFDLASLEAWAQFGDSFNMLNTMYSSIALVGVLIAIFLQQQELRLQRQELEQNRQEFKDAALENAFFKMLEAHQVMAENIVIRERKLPLKSVLPSQKKANKAFEEIKRERGEIRDLSEKQPRLEYKGLEALDHLQRALQKLGFELARITAKEEKLKIWRRSLSNLRESLERIDCYICSFLNILDYVDEQRSYEEKVRLVNIATSRLTQIELRFLCHFFGRYNLEEDSPGAISRLSKFQQLNSKYKILRNLHPADYVVRPLDGDPGFQFMWSFEGKVFQSDDMIEAAESMQSYGINFAP